MSSSSSLDSFSNFNAPSASSSSSSSSSLPPISFDPFSSNITSADFLADTATMSLPSGKQSSVSVVNTVSKGEVIDELNPNQVKMVETAAKTHGAVYNFFANIAAKIASFFSNITTGIKDGFKYAYRHTFGELTKEEKAAATEASRIFHEHQDERNRKNAIAAAHEKVKNAAQDYRKALAKDDHNAVYDTSAAYVNALLAESELDKSVNVYAVLSGILDLKNDKFFPTPLTLQLTDDGVRKSHVDALNRVANTEGRKITEFEQVFKGQVGETRYNEIVSMYRNGKSFSNTRAFKEYFRLVVILETQRREAEKAKTEAAKAQAPSYDLEGTKATLPQADAIPSTSGTAQYRQAQMKVSSLEANKMREKEEQLTKTLEESNSENGKLNSLRRQLKELKEQLEDLEARKLRINAAISSADKYRARFDLPHPGFIGISNLEKMTSLEKDVVQKIRAQSTALQSLKQRKERLNSDLKSTDAQIKQLNAKIEQAQVAFDAETAIRAQVEKELQMISAQLNEWVDCDERDLSQISDASSSSTSSSSSSSYRSHSRTRSSKSAIAGSSSSSSGNNTTPTLVDVSVIAGSSNSSVGDQPLLSSLFSLSQLPQSSPSAIAGSSSSSSGNNTQPLVNISLLSSSSSSSDGNSASSDANSASYHSLFD